MSLANYMKGLCEQFLFPRISWGRLRLRAPSTQEAIGWEAELSCCSFEVRCSKRLLYLQPFWEMPRCPAIYCIWHHDDCQVSLLHFLFISLNIYECRRTLLPWYQPQSITVWASLQRARSGFQFFVIICIYYASVYIHGVKSARYSKLITARTRSPSLPQKQNKFAFPSKGSSFTYLMQLIQT